MLWQVTRFCCLSGMCFTCRAIVTGGVRKRILVEEKVTQEEAERLARLWADYGGQTSEMARDDVAIVGSRLDVAPSDNDVGTDLR
jgi:hypothetical protein